ncbi:MAG: hypothetical protein B6229_05945 [Spirochaetaceae bacterium 4572_7]|nr:MAG: hypothetical protein B6229_05945 [Spirochaetaceae bacterium 4572_7]
MLYKRKDAQLIDNKIPIFNRMIPYMMRGRNESIITLKEPLVMTNTLEFINSTRDEDGKRLYTYFEVLLAAIMRILTLYPRLNRFIMDGHYYKRNELSISFVIKTVLDIDEPERNVTLKCKPGETIEEISTKVRKLINEAKTTNEDDGEKALLTLFKFPSFIVNIITKAIIGLDKKGLLPLSMTDVDALHVSAFVANLGSIGINDAPAHHLFEWGTCSIFITSGRIRKEQVVSKTGEITVEDVLNICFSIDERIADGFYYSQVIKKFKQLIANPEELLTTPKPD